MQRIEIAVVIGRLCRGGHGQAQDENGGNESSRTHSSIRAEDRRRPRNRLARNCSRLLTFVYLICTFRENPRLLHRLLQKDSRDLELGQAAYFTNFQTVG